MLAGDSSPSPARAIEQRCKKLLMHAVCKAWTELCSPAFDQREPQVLEAGLVGDEEQHEGERERHAPRGRRRARAVPLVLLAAPSAAGVQGGLVPDQQRREGAAPRPPRPGRGRPVLDREQEQQRGQHDGEPDLLYQALHGGLVARVERRGAQQRDGAQEQEEVERRRRAAVARALVVVVAAARHASCSISCVRARSCGVSVRVPVSVPSRLRREGYIWAEKGKGSLQATELRFTWGGRTPRCLRQGVNATRRGANRAGTRALPPPTDGAGLAVTMAWNLGSAGAGAALKSTRRQAPTDRRMEQDRSG